MDCEQLSSLSKSDSSGREFEKAVLRVFKGFDFEIDEGWSGQSGELDVIIIEPVKIGIECRVSKGEIGVNILDELGRHLRRYEESSGSGNFVGLIIGEDFNWRLIQDANSVGRYLLKASTLQKLCEFSEAYPFEPKDFRAFFDAPGEIDSVVLDFIKEKTKKYSSKGIVEKKTPVKKDIQPIDYAPAFPRELTASELKKLKGKSPVLKNIYKKLRSGISKLGPDVKLYPDDKIPIRFEVKAPGGKSIVFARVEIQTRQIKVNFKIDDTFKNPGIAVDKSTNSSFGGGITLNSNQDDLISNALSVIKQSYDAVKSGTYK